MPLRPIFASLNASFQFFLLKSNVVSPAENVDVPLLRKSDIVYMC